MKILMEMGHGDEIVIGDGNFPAASTAQRLVRCDGTGIVELLEAVMPLFPLDTFVREAAILMEVVPGDDYTPPTWDTYRNIIAAHNPWFEGFSFLDRQDFYVRTKSAYAVVATSEKARYANIILKKGIV